MSNETKQTALEKFIEKLEEIGDLRECTSLGLIQLNIDKNEYLALKEQAKEIEKEQIKSAFNIGELMSADYYDGKEDCAENYYNTEYRYNK
jgi:hypothetical protein